MTPSTNPRFRPSSSLSNHRPPSSASSRPLSRLSTRTSQRHARSRLIPFAQALVKQVTGFEETQGEAEALAFRESVDFVVKNLEATTLNKGAVSVDMGAVEQQIKGLSLKARINVQDDLAKALETCYRDLKEHVEFQVHNIDHEIQRSHISDHVQFLLSLSTVPTRITHLYASSYLYDRAHPPRPPEPLTWAAIVAEEPFEGEHWEGVYGLPPGFVRKSQDGTKHFYDKDIERERLDWDSRWSTPSLSPLKSDDLDLESDDDLEEDMLVNGLSGEKGPALDPAKRGLKTELEERGAKMVPPYTHAHRKDFEALKARQYWRKDRKGEAVAVGRDKFDMGDASTLGPTLRSILRPTRAGTSNPIFLDAFIQNEARSSLRHINEEDAVREVLLALQGRKNVMLEWKANTLGEVEEMYAMTQSTPSLLHLSLGSQASILTTLGRTATIIQHLRQFVRLVFESLQGQKSTRLSHNLRGGERKTESTRTQEAFADAVDHEIRLLDKWCAAREEAMCRAWGGTGALEDSPHDAGDDRLVISLLRTEKDVRDTFERTFEVLLALAREIFPPSTGSTRRGTCPAAISATLLDRLFESVQEHLERREKTTSEALMRVFVRTAEPVWDMLGRWLRDGMGLGVGIGTGNAESVRDLEEEFFIESSGLGLGMMGVGLLDPEFWKEGYTLRERVVLEGGDEDGGKNENGSKVVPLFLEHIAELALGAGKAIGLLRALEVPLSSITPNEGDWRPFSHLIGPFSTSTSGARLDLTSPQESNDSLLSVSIDTLSRLIYDELLPRCTAADTLLVNVLVKECSLWKHLESIEDLFLMKKGDVMSHFADILFAKMDAQQPWGDFHFLNTAFTDVVAASMNFGTKQWIQTPLVRMFYRGGMDNYKAANRTVKVIDGLSVEYAIPFPLTYIVQPISINTYGEIFVFLLQIRRAKNVLERILVRGSERGKKPNVEMKVFYAMGNRLSWIINILLNFFTTYVIQAQVLKFHEAFREAKSLDEMVRLHDDHLDTIRGHCLLKPNTSSLHQAILSILDMALNFTSSFVTFAGDTSTASDFSRSVSVRRHRSRRQRKQRRNVIGFSVYVGHSEDSSDEDMDIKAPELSFSAIASISYAEEGFQDQIGKMSTELDGLVRFLRRGVESLAEATGEAAPAFGVLAFALEDWDY